MHCLKSGQYSDKPSVASLPAMQCTGLSTRIVDNRESGRSGAFWRDQTEIDRVERPTSDSVKRQATLTYPEMAAFAGG